MTSSIVTIECLDGEVQHRRKFLMHRFLFFRDYFDEYPTESRIKVPLYSRDVENLFDILDEDLPEEITFNTVREYADALKAADYLGLTESYANRLLGCDLHFDELRDDEAEINITLDHGVSINIRKMAEALAMVDDPKEKRWIFHVNDKGEIRLVVPSREQKPTNMTSVNMAIPCTNKRTRSTPTLISS